MTIAAAITAAQGRVANAYTAISNKGGTLPATQNLANMPTAINSIPSSGGETIITAENLTGSAISAGDKVWLNEDNGSYEIIPTKIAFDVDKKGNLNISSSGIASNFSTLNYIETPIFNPANNTFEIFTKVHTGQTIHTLQIIFGNGGGYDRCWIGIENSKFFFKTSDTDRTWGPNLADVIGSHTVLADTDYWIKCVFNGSKYSLYYSLDGSTFTLDGEVTSSSVIYSADYPISVGLNIWYSGYYGYVWEGTMDLSQTYIKINNTVWWQPWYMFGITQDTITGIAKENLAINETGDVAVGMVEATGTISITENGTYDVTNYESADVNVAGGSAIQTIFSGETDANGVYTPAFMLEYEGDVSFDGIKSIDTSAYAANEKGTFASYFYHEIVSNGRQRLKTRLIKGKISFPDLETINDYSCFYSFCNGQTKITEISFDKLEEVLGSYFYTFNYFCAGASSLRVVRFPKLSYFYEPAMFTEAFRNTSTLDIYFNGLTTSTFANNYKAQFKSMMTNSGTTGIHKIHFPSNLESTIQGLSGYPLFGGTSGYVVLAFDLPQTN